MLKRMLSFILREGDDIINNTESVVKIFNEYFNQIASDIGFNDHIPDSYADDDVLLYFIAKYNKHPSIIAIKSAVHEYGIFEFRYANIDHILIISSKFWWLWMTRKLQAVTVFHVNSWQLVLSHLLKFFVIL